MSAADPPFSSIRYLPTEEAYDRWAAVYDTDGNFLQAIDTLEMKTLFPQFIASIRSPRPWRIVDLGCGTGRNTALLLDVPDTQVVALDASRGMLAVAESRLSPPSSAQGDTSIGTSPSPKNPHFALFDMLASPAPPAAAQRADAVVSTLVAEHVPLAVFFAQASRMLARGGVLLLTNMHARMGAVSQAGFVDTATGLKIRPTSYAHAAEDVVAEARRWGRRVEGEGEGEGEGKGENGGLRERAVTADMVERLGPRSAKWVGVTCWFGGLFRKVEDVP